MNNLKKHFRPGRAYRRADVAAWSKSVDRDLQNLVEEGFLTKLRAGMYYRPKQSAFGDVPAADHELVETFLKDDRFLLTSPNAYNALRLGTTQLYNKQVVYNHKRHGDFVLGGRTFSFRMKHHFPTKGMTEEFLLVDLLNNLENLAEDQESLRERVAERARSMAPRKLKEAVRNYGEMSTKSFFSKALSEGSKHAHVS